MNEAISSPRGGLVSEATASQATVTLDPELSASLAQREAERRRKENLRVRVLKERRVLFPLLGMALLMLPNFGRAKVMGNSMYPQYNNGDTLVLLKTYRLFSPIKVGDIVVLQKKEGGLEGEDLVKRVVFIQNEEGNAPWPKTITNKRGTFETVRLFPREVMGFVKVPPRHIYVMGDNVWNSTDSRDPEVGAVAENEIIGKVLNH
jgi:signal peptidase I